MANKKGALNRDVGFMDAVTIIVKTVLGKLESLEPDQAFGRRQSV